MTDWLPTRELLTDLMAVLWANWFHVGTAILATIAVTGVVLNNYRVRVCFYLWLISNTGFVLVDLYKGIPARAIEHAIFMCLAIHGLLNWKKGDEIR